MKSKILGALLVGAVCTTSLLPASAADEEAGFQKLFNGQDLTGWAGRAAHWSVEDGAITGITTKDTPAQGNNFLIAREGDKDLIVGDFEFRCAFKFTGDWGNSGIQYRSQALPNFVVHGYQADMETGLTYSGILYEEGGRGILAQRGQKVVIKDDPANPGKPKIEVVGSLGDPKEIGAAINPLKWNDYVVIAKGNHLQHFINGHPTVDVVDEQVAKAAKSGILALQLHAGQPMKIQFKNLRLKPLSAPGATSSDLDRIQGEWKVKQLVLDGQDLDAATIADAKLIIKKDTFKLDAAGQNAAGTLQFDAQANPKTLEVSLESGETIPAIYELNGPTLKICYAMNSAARPKEFKSTSGSDHVFVVYQRSLP